ncbi:glutathione S-transferase family protein [Roseateles chitosanitabidus]|uniref:glutathione S-transferase family protein n=1 Tax=Roseateles chitosanitabidus TaxID=65048 RepID=UPI000834F72F|nr:glutathione S-transferase family protein [Roseateles chitosanitabidus]
MTTSPHPPHAGTAAGYVLYGTRGSGSAIAEIALRWCGQPYRTVHASSWEEQSARDELRAVNPLMQIPTLRTPEGEVLSESAAILMHLGLRFPDARLLGADERARDQILRGLVYIAANCYSCISITDYPERYTTSGDPAQHEAVRQGGRARLHRHWALFADMFPARPWLCGAQPGALDVMAGIVSKWSGTRQHLQAQRPEFLALLQRIEALPQVADVHAAHWPPT